MGVLYVFSLIYFARIRKSSFRPQPLSERDDRKIELFGKRITYLFSRRRTNYEKYKKKKTKKFSIIIIIFNRVLFRFTFIFVMFLQRYGEKK